ncbi:MAG: hypothetical protein V9G20_30280 [Candidatus Promineifilaceae bacterium]
MDGGGTNCRIRLADENLNTLADAAGGRSNLQIDNGDPAFSSITEGTAEVFRKAGIDIAEANNTFACFGMAGGRLPSAREAFASASLAICQPFRFLTTSTSRSPARMAVRMAR